tara:strand:+ start:177 stop:977 length:801 start_codon:yes stop_codon:yes gene_type:complete
MEWKIIDPSDYNQTEEYYEINEMGIVRIITTKRLIKLQTGGVYNLKSKQLSITTLQNKYCNPIDLKDYIEIKDYPRYLINPRGDIYNKSKCRILASSTVGGSYYNVRLINENGGKTILLHRLIALNFIPNLRNYAVINHKDGNRLNNNLSNLEWCSYAYNSQTENTLRNPAKILYTKTYRVVDNRQETIFKTEQDAIDFNENLKKYNPNRTAKHYKKEIFEFKMFHNTKKFNKSSINIKVVVDYRYTLLLMIKYANKFKKLVGINS